MWLRLKLKLKIREWEKERMLVTWKEEESTAIVMEEEWMASHVNERVFGGGGDYYLYL